LPAAAQPICQSRDQWPIRKIELASPTVNVETTNWRAATRTRWSLLGSWLELQRDLNEPDLLAEQSRPVIESQPVSGNEALGINGPCRNPTINCSIVDVDFDCLVQEGKRLSIEIEACGNLFD